MANTYTQIYIHVVFAVKRRENLIDKKWKDELYKYICGIVNGNKQKVYAINGVSDHIHILLSIRPDVSLSELMRDIKGCSSKWINEKKFMKEKFQWQEGYGAFSYSHSQLNTIIKYIENQEAHHAKKTFKDEYYEFLEAYKIEHYEKYVFDWIN
jgi:putative transposase